MAVSIPRLSEDELEPRLAEQLRPRVERLGYLGEFFRCAAHQPDALRAFVDFTEAGKQGLPDRLVELIALTAATVLGNDYERNQHERLSVRLGFGRAWVERVEASAGRAGAGGAGGGPASGELEADEAAVQRYVLAALERHGRGVTDELEAVVERLGPAGAVAVMFVLGRYVTHALVVNSLALEPPVPSIFEDGFDGD